MRITLAAAGRLRQGALAELIEDYLGRLDWDSQIREVEAKKGLHGEQLREAEAKALLDAVPDGAYLIALDQTGKPQTSESFAELLGELADSGRREIAFLIGGAEGHGQAVREKADRLISLGPMTWPHMLVRLMLSEQLFRARSILKGHPYHRG